MQAQRRIIVGVGLLVALIGVTFAHGKSESMCKAADRWVNARVAAGTLPTTLPELATVEMPYRKAAFRQLPIAQKRALWRQQVTAFAQSRPLTPEQAAFVKDDLALIGRSYETQMSRAEYNALVARFLATFTDGKELIAFRHLGGPDVRRFTLRAALTRIAPALGASNCECSMYGGGLFVSDCPNDGNYWYCKDDNCYGSWWGCGFQWMQACDGACYSTGNNGLTGATRGQPGSAAPAQ